MTKKELIKKICPFLKRGCVVEKCISYREIGWEGKEGGYCTLFLANTLREKTINESKNDNLSF